MDLSQFFNDLRDTLAGEDRSGRNSVLYRRRYRRDRMPNLITRARDPDILENDCHLIPANDP
jgi:hypothetical protein